MPARNNNANNGKKVVASAAMRSANSKRTTKRRNNTSYRLAKDSLPSIEESKPQFVTRPRFTQAGTDWLRTYLNPNGKSAGALARHRIPDGTAKRTGVFNMHRTKTFSSPFKTDENWSLFAIQTNQIYVSHILVALRGGADELSDGQSVSVVSALINSPLINEWVITHDTAIYIYIYVPAEFVNYLASGGAHYSTKDFLRVRVSAKGDTFRFAGSTLENEGTVTCSKFPSTAFSMDQTHPDTDPAAAPDIYRMTVNPLPPLKASYCTQADPSSYQGRASDGCYSICYNTSQNFEWHNSSEEKLMRYYNGSSEIMNGTINPSNFFSDITMNEKEIGVIIFAGLSNTASIEIESRQGVEYVATPGSTYQSMQEDAPSYDPTPIQLARSVTIALQSGYSAAYNDWGKLWGVIKGILPGVASHVPVIGPALSGLLSGIFRGGS